MTLTLLVDLDDTLLVNDANRFISVYLKLLAGYMAEHVAPQLFVPTMMAATQQMMVNQRPDRCLKETFDTAFYPSLGPEQDKVRGKIDDFYANVFPALQEYTIALPQAVTFVEGALQRGCQLVIATNPLFPRTAIHQRLNWGGVSPEKYPFRLVTSYETFHFSKPNPAYYAEILARLGWSEGPVVMVGDDLEMDIIPARRLGLAAFWINAEHTPPPNGKYAPTAQGALADVLPWLTSLAPESLRPNYTSPDSALAILRSTPAALHSLTADLSAADWRKSPQAGEWSVTEILCHLRDVEQEVNLPRLHKVMQEANPFLPAKDTDRWAQERNYGEQDGAGALTAFTERRIALCSILESLEVENWERPARHAIFGPTQLKELVTIIAGHDRLHVQQVHGTITAMSPATSS